MYPHWAAVTHTHTNTDRDRERERSRETDRQTDTHTHTRARGCRRRDVTNGKIDNFSGNGARMRRKREREKRGMGGVWQQKGGLLERGCGGC